jgi:hypothetical protein
MQVYVVIRFAFGMAGTKIGDVGQSLILVSGYDGSAERRKRPLRPGLDIKAELAKP